MVSTDVIVEASATLIAGMIFLVSVRQALRLEVYRKMVATGIVIFILAMAAAIFEDLLPSELHWPKIATWALFLGGLFFLTWLIWIMARPKEATYVHDVRSRKAKT
jgi:Ca2+/Na+ antiporter